MMPYRRVIVVTSAIIATLLQVFLSPHIAIYSAIPNFMIAICLVRAVAEPQDFNCVLPFVLGLIFDFISGGPVGVMAFSLTAFSVGTAWFHERANNDTVFMALVSLAVGLLLVEVAYGLFLLMFGYSISLLEAIGYRILPCYLYDLVITLILYFIASRFAGADGPSQSEITQLQ